MVLSDCSWIALVIGNSRRHWGYFQGEQLIRTWDDLVEDPTDELSKNHQLVVASVVEQQTKLWQQISQARVLNLANIPLRGTYPTLGIDRALSLWGAMTIYGYPCLVIDGGTALTFTGVDHQAEFAGGAILPGLALQFASLKERTSKLPLIHLTSDLPPRWARSTETAIQSGIIHTTLAGIREFIQDWWIEFPDSPIILTGGDGLVIYHYLAIERIKVDQNLIFWGMRAIALET